MPFTLHKPYPVSWRQMLLAFLALFATAWLGVELGLSLGLNVVSLVWAPSGIAVALALHYGPRILPAVFLGNLAATTLTGTPFLFNLLAATGNTLEPLTAMVLLQHLQRKTPPANRVSEVLRYCFLAGLAAPLPSAFFGTVAMYVSGIAPAVMLPGSFGIWWLGNVLGILVVGPFALALLLEGAPSFWRWKQEELLLLLAMLLASVVVFGGLLPPDITQNLAFLLLPFAVWAALRSGLRGQTGMVLGIAMVAVLSTWNGLGPFAKESLLTSLVTLGGFLFVVAFTSLLVGAVAADRQRVSNRMRLGEERLRLFTKFFPQGAVCLLDTELRLLLAGGLGLEHLDLDAAELPGKRFEEVLTPQTCERLQPMLEDALAGKSASCEISAKGRVYQVLAQPVVDDEDDGHVRNVLVIGHDLTERVRAEEALAGSYVFLQRTLDSIPNPVFIRNSDGRFRFVNKAFCETMHLRPADVLGKTLYDISPHHLAEIYNQRDQDLLRNEIKGQSYCTKVVTADLAEEKQLYICKSLVQDPVTGDTDIVGLAMDISELHTTQKNLEASEARYRALFEQMGLAALLADIETGQVLDANKQACALWKRSREELLALKQPQLVPPEFHEQARQRFQNHVTQGSASSDNVEILDAEGMRVPVEIVSVVLQHEGRPALLGLFKDVSERIKLEQLRHDVEMMTRHDLKSPLNGIIGLPHIFLQDASCSEEQQEIARIIQDSGRRMLQMINLSLDLYKMETGGYELHAEPMDLPPLLATIAKELEDAAKRRNLRIEICRGTPATCAPLVGDYVNDGAGCVDTSQESQFTVQGEQLLCYSMFANLMKNAVEAAPAGSTIALHLEQENVETAVHIHNQGAVPEAIRDRFFDKYVTMGKKDGTGLGVYSARLIAETHGGSLAMQSSDAHGTTVTVRLPRP